MNKIYKPQLALISFLLIALSAPSFALNQGDWILRFGAASINPDDSSGSFSAAPTVGASVDGSDGFFLSLTYMIRNNLGIEALAATPFTHDIEATGGVTGQVAETKQLPPTVSLLYYFNPDSNFRTYVGAGINYTFFFDEETSGDVVTSLSLEDSWGMGAVIGADYDLNDKWHLHGDIRYLDISTTATTNVGTVDVDINPWVYSIGIGTTF